MSSDRSDPSLVLAIDLGTSSVRTVAFNKQGLVVALAQEEYPSLRPEEGHVEQDTETIWSATCSVIGKILDSGCCPKSAIVALGIANQRETIVIWDRLTGKPYHNAIVWSDTRTSASCAKLQSEHGVAFFQDKTGLPVNPYFSATKIRWILDHVPSARAGAESGVALCGTMDTWLVWKLSNRQTFVTGLSCCVHIERFVDKRDADATNASRTLLMNLRTLEWDDELCSAFGVPKSLLPGIKSSSEVFGYCQSGLLDGVVISGILGDQQAALFGQTCFRKGDAKNTYGTGAFTMMNTGSDVVRSTNGLLSTVAYKIGTAPVVYALEGSVAVCGALMQWLRDKMGMLSDVKDSEAIALSVSDTGGVVVVPAFSGLFAPYWRGDARGVILGLSGYTTAAHVVRACLEACAFQVFELIEAMEGDLGEGHELTSLRVDGGMVANNFLLQAQADVLQRQVIRPKVSETTALGAAYAAGLAVGFWSSLEELEAQWQRDRVWEPALDRESRDSRVIRWKGAVLRTLDWVDVSAAK